MDTTVVETPIHYPTDSTLLGDGVRVLTRTMRKVTVDPRAQSERSCATGAGVPTHGCSKSGGWRAQSGHGRAIAGGEFVSAHSPDRRPFT